MQWYQCRTNIVLHFCLGWEGPTDLNKVTTVTNNYYISLDIFRNKAILNFIEQDVMYSKWPGFPPQTQEPLCTFHKIPMLSILILDRLYSDVPTYMRALLMGKDSKGEADNIYLSHRVLTSRVIRKNIILCFQAVPFTFLIVVLSFFRPGKRFS